MQFFYRVFYRRFRVGRTRHRGAVGSSSHSGWWVRSWAGWNSSITLPEGSSNRICEPPGPVTERLSVCSTSESGMTLETGAA